LSITSLWTHTVADKTLSRRVVSSPVGQPTIFDMLMQYVEAKGNLAGTASLFLSFWNSVALSGDTARAATALAIWNKAIASATQSDVEDTLFYDASTATLYVIATSVLKSLNSTAAVMTAWNSGVAFGSELAKLALRNYVNPFVYQVAPTAKATAALAVPADTSGDWYKFGVSLVGTVGTCGAVIFTGPETFGATFIFGGMRCIATYGTLVIHRHYNCQRLFRNSRHDHYCDDSRNCTSRLHPRRRFNRQC
jgi:hypothetical protein